MSVRPVLIAAGALLAAMAYFTDAQATSLIANGGFEDGTTTVGGNSGIPVDWTPNAACQSDTAFCRVNAGTVGSGTTHSGTNAMIIGNFDRFDTDGISQTLATVSGDHYTADFYYWSSGSGDPNAFFEVFVNGIEEFSSLDTVHSYTLGTFNFVGTGSDVFTIMAKTDPGDWFVDDVSVNGVGATPLPATWTMLLIGLAGLGFVSHRRNRQAALPMAA